MGGNGGGGGTVWLNCNPALNTLLQVRRKTKYIAQDGENGADKGMKGKNAPQLVIDVPPGTIVRSQDGLYAGELTKTGDKLLIARGGKGGRGNMSFKGDKNLDKSEGFKLAEVSLGIIFGFFSRVQNVVTIR